MVSNSHRRTPANVRFTAKLPKIITHEKRFKNVEIELELFYETMEPLQEKMLALLIQLPLSYELKEGLEDFRNYNFFFEGSFRYAVEVRHTSWMNELAYNFLDIITLQWSGVKWIDCKLLQK